MARNGNIYATGLNGEAKVLLKWNILSQSAATNSSTIGWELVLEAKNGISWTFNGRDCSIKFDGKTIFTSDSININTMLQTTTKPLASGTTTIAHTPNGSKTFDYSFTLEWDM